MHRPSFTLVELMVSIALMAIVASMMAMAMSSASEDARRMRAQGQVQRINQIVLNRYEEEAARRMPADFFPAGSNPAISGYKLRRSSEAAVFRLTALRDYLRIVMPDRRSDVIELPVVVRAPLSTINSSGQLVYSSAWFMNPEIRSQARLRYVQRLTHLLGLPSNATNAQLYSAWSATNESAECLYLILSTTAIDGVPVLEDFRQSDIRDTDNDGVPEIIDPWERPIAWIRWPVGYWLTYTARDETDPVARTALIDEARGKMGRDELDVLQCDWGLQNATTADDTCNVTPLVISAGPDGIFDLLLPEMLGTPVAYSNMQWNVSNTPPNSDPTAPPAKIPTTPPYVGPYYYPDPFCRNYYSYDYINSYQKFDANANRGVVGAYYDQPEGGGSGNSKDDSGDNYYGIAL